MEAAAAAAKAKEMAVAEAKANAAADALLAEEEAEKKKAAVSGKAQGKQGKGKKGKGGKGKKGGKGAGDGGGDDNISKEELEDTIQQLKDELRKEMEERNYFQLERDKINTFWEISKKELEDRKVLISTH